MRALQLTAARRQLLEAGLDTPPGTGFSRRALALLALAEGQSVAEVADLLGVTRQRIYNWRQAYEAAPQPESLADRYGAGRPRLWTPHLERLLHEGLHERPDDFGYPGMNWTVPLRRTYLHDQADGWRSEDTIRRQLQRQGYVWKRYRYVLPPDPEREKKTRHPPALGAPAAAERGLGGG